MNHNIRDIDNKSIYGPGGYTIHQYGYDDSKGEMFPSIEGENQEKSALDSIRLFNDESNKKSADQSVEHDTGVREIVGRTKGVGPFPEYGYESEGRGVPAIGYGAANLNNDYGSVVRNNDRRESNQVSPSRGNFLVTPLTTSERRKRWMKSQKEKNAADRVNQPINKEPVPDAPPMRPYNPEDRNAVGGWIGRSLLGQWAPFTMTTQDKDDAVRDFTEKPVIPKRITSLKEQISRYYPAESGGVEGAIDKAQAAQEENPGDLDRKRWPKQTRSGVEGDQLVGYGPSEEGRRPNSAAYYQSPQTDSIGIRGLSQEHTIPGFSYVNDADDNSFGKDNDDQNSLEHELTHGSILGGPDFRTPGIGTEAKKNAGPFSPLREYEGDNESHNPSMYYQPKDLRYAMNPAEIDVRLAEIKRRYAYHTGIIVDTPEKAEQAIKWFNSTRGKRRYEMGEPDSGYHELWNMLTPDQKDEIYYRMPELVMDTKVLEGLT